MLTIKQGDKYSIDFTANTSLVGTTQRLLVRHGSPKGTLEVLEHTVEDAANGVVQHITDGTWEPGCHYLELEITNGSEIRTAPTAGYEIVYVTPDLDQEAE